MENFVVILTVCLFISAFLLPAAAGAYIFFYPHKAINASLKLSRRVNVYNVEPYWDPQGSFIVSFYRFVGLLFLLVFTCPLILIIYSVWSAIVHNRPIYFNQY